MKSREHFVGLVARVAGGTTVLGLYLCLVIEMYGSIIDTFKEWAK